MSPIGFAVVGCGMIARFHVRALAEIPGTRIAALVSRTPANAEALLEETGTPPCPVFATVDEALKAPGVDAVVITTPSGAHLEPAAGHCLPGAGRGARGLLLTLCGGQGLWLHSDLQGHDAW